MTTLTIPDLPDDVHRALAKRGAASGRSVEQEARDLLQAVTAPSPNAGLGSRLRAFGEKHGGIELERRRLPEAPRPADFE